MFLTIGHCRTRWKAYPSRTSAADCNDTQSTVSCLLRGVVHTARRASSPPREAAAGRPRHGRIPSDACQASSRGPVARRPGLGRARPVFPVNDLLNDSLSARPPAPTLLTYVLVTVAHELERWFPPRSYLAPQNGSTGCWSTNAVNQHRRKTFWCQPSGACLTRLFHLLPGTGNARTTSRTKWANEKERWG